MFCFFPPLTEASGILAPLPGTEPPPPALGGEILATGPPGKSPVSLKGSENHKYVGNASWICVRM